MVYYIFILYYIFIAIRSPMKGVFITPIKNENITTSYHFIKLYDDRIIYIDNGQYIMVAYPDNNNNM